MIKLIVSFISNNFYRIVKRHIDKKMIKAKLEINFIKINGDSFEYWDNNASKPAIFLVHGFGTSAEYQWYKQVNVLSKDYRIIIPNLFYFGRSNSISKKFRIEDQVEFINLLSKHLNLDSIIFFGISYGGQIAIDFTKKYPQIVKSLVIVNSPIKFYNIKDVEEICESFDVSNLQDLFVPHNYKDLKKIFYLALGKKWILPSFFLKPFYKNLYINNFNEKRHLISHSVDRINHFTKVNYSFDTPTLMIYGGNDKITSTDKALLLKNHIGNNAKFTLIKKGTHMPNITQTDKFNEIVLNFLNKA
ncbi:MAG: hypothetical protein CL844_06330 [Crocinitomicaceae bacterium]|nr:hypothetical protein [Crocinitomicaceae bacterium]|tara:strand:+ start:17274 stop:18182 length:909 start_codon:yes stop_codon:yes gene_type:complete